eukprot:TRINITY_DN212_c0_g2_i1.p1 TRINITY_DN212_c0_g2~~TRINITY_DN212_c0_g2_i1.p1  ORF type:complete len:355 (-),score=128.90 TRINITY_DN212_c0_g2_i1:27-983(-)
MQKLLKDTEGIAPQEVAEIAVLAALTVEPWNVDDAVEWAVAYNSAKPDEEREGQVQKEIQRMIDEGFIEEDDEALWTAELISSSVRAVGKNGTVDEAIAWMARATICPKVEVCRREPVDEEEVDEIKEKLEELIENEEPGLEDVDPEDVDKLSELAALTTDDIEEAIEFIKTYTSTDPDPEKEKKVKEELEKIFDEEGTDMTYDDELIEDAVKAVGEEGTPEEAIEWLTKVIPCPTPMCNEERLDEEKFEEVKERLEETKGINRKDVDELAKLAALTVDPWNVDDAVEWAVTYNSAEPNEERERQVKKEKVPTAWPLV